ncbi:hypothetical protein SETIT_1G144900v2 [Setaria italica]|uniref:Uncharacterized protein n=2 Tax=Setaria TaxID=4554 RepID=K3YXM1_SETIT|nr:hypothetical protein SETIT_1G144900v2 [Setaria italica]TKW38885.1 hypothetical protein SEVIR_1G143800v2 [Setaria viridis]
MFCLGNTFYFLLLWQLLAFISLVSDNTGRKQLQKTIKDSPAKLSKLIDSKMMMPA